MSIKNFEQFINESVEVNKERLCNNEAMNEIYSKLVELSRQSLDRNIEKLTLQLKLIERAFEMIKEKYGEHIVGEEKEIRIGGDIGRNYHRDYYDGMNDIEIEFNTDIPSIEYEDYYDDFVVKLENNINDLFDLEYNNEYVNWEDRLNIDLGIDDENDPLKISVRVSGINTIGLINLCQYNDRYHKEYIKILDKISDNIYKNSKN